jgi:hypothetical protein
MELKTCVVCGAGSHRTDWINKSGNEVACDSHSKDEVARAIVKAQQSKTVAPAPNPGAHAPATKGTPIPPK